MRQENLEVGNQTRKLNAGAKVQLVPDTGVTPLSHDEELELRTREATIEKGLTVFKEVGQALLDIRDKKLYRATHKNFEDYCRERWEFSKTQANRLIGASKTAEVLEKVGAKPEQLRESNLRPLVGLPPKRQQAIWKKATATNEGPITAAKIQALVQPVAASKRAVAPVRRIELNAAMRAIRKAFKIHNGPSELLNAVLRAIRSI